MILAIDAGNTRVKWGLHNGESWEKSGITDLLYIDNLAKEWAKLPSPRRILACNVAGENVRNFINLLCLTWRVEPEWLAASHSLLGVNNSYEDPTQLGPDRWAALIAAKYLHKGSSVVVNLGTAMTVDALNSEGQFLGGIIVPGFFLMQQALADGAAELELSATGNFNSFPVNTADGVYSGVIQALTGAVMRMEEALKLSGQVRPVCILSGGDSHILRPHLNMKVMLVDNLVLEGLIRIGRE